MKVSLNIYFFFILYKCTFVYIFTFGNLYGLGHDYLSAWLDGV